MTECVYTPTHIYIYQHSSDTHMYLLEHTIFLWYVLCNVIPILSIGKLLLYKFYLFAF